MAKAQSFFGGTNPKQTGKDSTSNQVGHSSAGTHNTSQQIRDNGAGSYSLKPPVTRYSSGGKGNNSQMIRDGKTTPAHRPNVQGKVDNRKVGK